MPSDHDDIPEASEVDIVGPDGTSESIAGPDRDPGGVPDGDPGGVPDGDPGGVPDGDGHRTAPSTGRRRAAVAIGAVLVFALGVAVGTHLGDTGPQAEGSATPATSTTSGVTSPTGTGSTAATTASPTSPATVSSNADLVNGPRTAAGLCGHPVPLAAPLSVVLSRGPAPDVSLLIGAQPRRIDLGARTVSTPLWVTWPDRRGVSDIAAGSAGSLMIKTYCSGSPPDTIIATIGSQRLSTSYGGADIRGVFATGTRVWAVVVRQDAASGGVPQAMLAGPDTSALVALALPDGFVPSAGWHQYVVGTVSDGSAVSPIVVYDVSRGEVAARLAGDEPAQFVVAGGGVIWANHCESGATCPLHRYDLATGKSTAAGTVDGPLGHWIGRSPDGRRIVTRVGPPDGNPAAGATVNVIDVPTGSVTPLPGLELGEANASVAFSPDSQWLFAVVPTVDGTILAGYDADLRGPYQLGAPIPGPLLPTIPLAVVSGAG